MTKQPAKITVRMTGYPKQFDNIISASISLAANDKGTSCNIRLSDPDHVIGNALIVHSLASGGIKGVPQPTQPAVGSNIAGTADINAEAAALKPDPGTKTSYTQSWATIELLIVKEALKQGVTVPDQIVYMLATASGETGDGRDLIELWDGKGLQATYDGRKDLGNTTPGDGYRYRGRGLAQMTGRGMYVSWSRKLGMDLVNNPDQMATPAVAIPVLVRGMMEGAFTGRKLTQYITATSTDFYNARRVINGIVPSQVNKYLNKAKYYQGRIQSLLAQANPGTATPATPTQTPVAVSPIDKNKKSTITTVEPAKSVVVPDVTPVVAEEPIKGNKLIVQWYNSEFEFFHTGTDVSNDGTTVLIGQGLRWVLNRRRRTNSLQGIKFSDLAARVGRTQGITVEYQAAFDPTFLIVEQRGISDYQLLKREAGNAGLFISEEPGKVVIKSITQIKDTSIVLAVGDNLIKWVCKDRAIDADDTVDATSDPLLTKEVKGEIDPLTGKLRQSVPDIDAKKDANSVTGSSAAKTASAAIKTPGQDLTATQQIQRFKRVKGLPSSFTITQTPRVLEITPLSAIRTKGLSKFLDRVWLLDKITHNSDGTSTLDCFSPVDVLDITPPEATSTTSTTGNSGATNTPGQFQVPCDGLVTSLVGRRNISVAGASKNHQGTDIGSFGGANVPIYASLDGTVSFAGLQGGYGNLVKIAHANGWETRYGHNIRLDVQQGQIVKQGQQIALMGSTGTSGGVHCHFEVRDNTGRALTPTEYKLPSISTIGAKAVKGASS